MYALHYKVGRPPDYDMGIVGHRVDTRYHRIDELTRLTECLVTESGMGGGRLKPPIPMCPCTGVGPTGEFFFLGLGACQGMVASVGHRCCEWTDAVFPPGPAASGSRRDAIPQPTSTARQEGRREAVAEARGALPGDSATAGVPSAALVDTSRWETVRVALRDDQPAGAAERLIVHHASTPQIRDLAEAAR